jgi:L-2-hydroxyglutarate oxidase LhgO
VSRILDRRVVVVARTIEGVPPELIPTPYLAKGNYYTLSGARPFSHLVYPVPEEAGLGIHVTIDLGGQVRFGPDVEWIDRIDYDVDPGRAVGFYDAIRRYYPGLRDGAIEPGYAGIRPKIGPKGTQAADFVIQGPGEHGVPGLVNLFAIESPGLTSSLVLAREVAGALGLAVSRAA